MAGINIITSIFDVPKSISGKYHMYIPVPDGEKSILPIIQLMLRNNFQINRIDVYFSIGKYTIENATEIASKEIKCDIIGRDFSPAILAFQGLIGSGKSTLLDILDKKIGQMNIKVKIIEEPVKLWLEIGLLQKFYSDMKKYAFDLQMFAYLTRVLAKVNAIDDKTSLYLSERSEMTGRVFDKLQIMEPYQKEILSCWYNALDMISGQLKIKTHNVYLKPDVKVCYNRVIMRNRDGEAGNLKIEYEQKLEKAHNEYFGKCLIINGDLANGDFIKNEQIQNKIVGKILNNLIELDKTEIDITMALEKKEKEKKAIVIDGCIGAGKTSLSTVMVEAYSDKKIKAIPIKEPILIWLKNGIFQKYNKDKKFTYEFQTFASGTKILEIMNTYNNNPDADIFILERDLYSDSEIFMSMLNKYLDPMHLEMYKYFARLKELLPKIFVEPTRIFLKPKVKTCMERLKKRNRESEDVITEKNQEELEKAHIAFYEKYKGKKIILNGNTVENDFRDKDCKLVQDLIKEIG